MRSRRALRTRLLMTVVVVLGVALTVSVVVFNAILVRELSREADQMLETRVRAEAGALRVEDGRISLGVSPPGVGMETRVWVFADDGVRLAGPRVDARVEAAAVDLASGSGTRAEVPGRDTRLLAEPVVADGRRVGTVVAGVSLASSRRLEMRALIGSIALAGILLLLAAGATILFLRVALGPVSRMTRDAADWSEHDLDRRFDQGPPRDEITRLASTLDDMLDRLAAGVRRERHLVAEVSHELRTPLARIRAEVDLALRRPRDDETYRAALAAVGESADRLTTTIETLLATARQEAEGPRGAVDVVAATQAAVEACAPLAEQRGVTVSLEPAQGRVFARMAAGVAERIIQPLVENACIHATDTVVVSAAQAGGHVEVVVTDDGPGVAEADVQLVFEPGYRGGPDRGHDGAGLGLALARRLAAAAGGDVAASAGAPGRFTVRLPGAGSSLP